MEFIKKHKKAVIISSIILAILIVIVILMFTLFSLKEVELKFKTETVNISSQQVKEIEKQTLKYGGSVLFIGKEKIISDLEKQFPYLKIVNIETIIPNKFVIHCAEREELYSIYSNEKYYVLDEEFKILKIESSPQENLVEFNFESLEANPETGKYMPVKLNLNLSTAEEGQFLNLGSSQNSVLASEMQNIATTLLTAFEQNNRDISYVKGQFQVVELFFNPIKTTESSQEVFFKLCLRIVDRNGYEIQIYDAQLSLGEKISVLYSALSAASSDPSLLEDTTLIIYKNEKGNFAYSFI